MRAWWQKAIWFGAALTLVFGAGGCRKLLKRGSSEAPAESVVVAPPPPPAPPPAPPPPAIPPAVDAEPAPSGSAALVEVPDEAVPAPEDFEDEAFEKVTATNFRTELTTLKTDIEADAKPKL